MHWRNRTQRKMVRAARKARYFRKAGLSHPDFRLLRYHKQIATQIAEGWAEAWQPIIARDPGGFLAALEKADTPKERLLIA